jgi:hypothetical protein
MDYEQALLKADPVFLSSLVENPHTPEWVLGKIFEQGKIPVIDSFSRSKISLSFFKELLNKTPVSAFEAKAYLILSCAFLSSSSDILSFIVDEHVSSEDKFIPKELKLVNTYERLAANVNLPVENFKKLYDYAKHTPNPNDIIEKLVSNQSIPLEMLENILTNADTVLIISALSNISIPVEFIEQQFSKTTNYLILNAIAENPQTPEYILEKLCNSDNDLILSSLACNSSLPERLYENIFAAGHIRPIKSLLTSVGNVPSNLIEKIDHDATYHSYIIRNEFVSPSTLRKIDFNNTDSRSVRILLQRPFITEGIVKRVIESADSEVRREGFQHHLANIEDVIKAAENDFWAQKLLTDDVGSSNLYRKFYYHMKEKYSVSIAEIPESLIYDMLGWNDLGRRR